MPDIDPEVQKQIDQVAKAMVTKIYQEIQLEEMQQQQTNGDDFTNKDSNLTSSGDAPENSPNTKLSSFTLQKFYEQHKSKE